MPPDETITVDPVSQPTTEPETSVSGDSPVSSPTAVSDTPETSPEAPEASISVPDPSLVKDQNSTLETPTSQPENTQNQPSNPVDSAPSLLVSNPPTIPQTLLQKLREMSKKAKGAVFERKQKKLDRIMILFAKQTKITNDEVEKLLHVSDATATRYLSLLEQQGKIRQMEKTGKYTFYIKI